MILYNSFNCYFIIFVVVVGIRIIIDIYFDHEECIKPIDVIGNRIETEIPKSHILDHLQAQTVVN